VKASESLYERAFEASPAGMALHEPETGTLAEVNEAYAEAFGAEPAALAGAALDSLVAEPDRAAVRRATEAALGGGSGRVDAVVPGAEEGGRSVTIEFETVGDAGDERVLSTARATRDEGDEGGADDLLSKRRLEVALAGTDTGVWEWELETDELHWTESIERLFGLEPGTFEGTFDAFGERVHPEDLPDVKAALRTALEGDGVFRTEYRIRRDDGEERWVHARGETRTPEDGSRVMIGIVTDITDRKRNERRLRERERQYRQLVRRLPDAHYAVDDDWRITSCNEAFARRHDATVEALDGRDLRELLPGVEDGAVGRRLGRVMESGDSESFEHQYEADGAWVDIHAYPYDDGVAVLSTDLSASQQELASVLDAAPIVLYRLDADGVFREARGQVLSRLDVDPDDLIGESIRDLYADDDEIIDAAERALDGETVRYTPTLNGITLETQYTPVYDDGELTGAIGVSMDVTELHRQRERMEFFNSILRHDVLNGMTVIKMRGELLADELEGDHREYARTVVDWCDTTTEVVKRVRRVVDTLTTPEDEHQLSRVDASAILERKCRELRTAYPTVEFDVDLPDSLHVRADELLADVLGNLLTNSVEHNDVEGLRVAVTATVEGGRVRLQVADNGTGVPDGRKESVFRRGETSAKETGSGFGLFFVDVMVGKYGGDAWVEDSEAGGARFVVELAATDRPGDERRVEADTPQRGDDR